MNVLSLFDGISCGQIALNRAGIKYDNYYASEIDKNAIKVTQLNFPRTIQLGDVTQVFGNVLPRIDLLFGGSPCQGFSFSGKQLNFNDPRSKLIFEFVRLLKETGPKYFLLENVRMKQEYQNVISELLGVSPIKINSSLVSAQNRERLYWTNIPGITAPLDKGILLKDIIEEDYDGVWVWPRGTNKGGVKDYKSKSPSVTTSSWQYNFLIYKNENTSRGLQIEGFIDKNGQGNRVYSVKGKSPCINATSGDVTGNGNGLILVKNQVTGTGLRGRKINNKWTQIPTLNQENKSNTITAHYRGKTDFCFIDGMVRKFTPTEVEKLQTVPVGYTNYISTNQRFKCLGNGWTVDVIVHILSFLPKFN